MKNRRLRLPDERQHPKQPQRRTYKAPALIEYGPVGKLTQAGMGSLLEGTMTERRLL